MSKITWNDIYEEFRKKFPKLSKAAVRHVPYGYMSILIYFSDGSKMVYDSATGRGKPIAG